MLECLGPFNGLNGNAIADSEGSLITLCSTEVDRDGSGRGVTSEDAENQADTEYQRQTKSRQSKRHSVFLPKDAPVKRSKKDRDLSTLA
ncbi:hypothetical protein DVH05_023556 [Phytophthora capsici]|nr:hypothetical protein DVH05_023556 [Phytophthora capsici]